VYNYTNWEKYVIPTFEQVMQSVIIVLGMIKIVLFVAGLPYDLGVYWQQYPWVLGETLCKLRALGSEM
jgi:hypothetical protein